MFCRNCGSENEPGAVFCRNCGKKMFMDSDRINTNTEKAAVRFLKISFIIVAIIILAVILLFYGVYMYYHS